MSTPVQYWLLPDTPADVGEDGGGTVAKDGVLGVEEVDLGVYCMAESRVIVIAHNAVVGHVAFGPQTGGMMRIIAGRADLGLER